MAKNSTVTYAEMNKLNRKMKSSKTTDEAMNELKQLIAQKEQEFGAQQDKLVQTLESLTKSTGGGSIDMGPIKSLIEQQNRAMQSHMSMMKDMCQQMMSCTSKPAQAYRFEVQRDNRGRINEMMASPVLNS